MLPISQVPWLAEAEVDGAPLTAGALPDGRAAAALDEVIWALLEGGLPAAALLADGLAAVPPPQAETATESARTAPSKGHVRALFPRVRMLSSLRFRLDSSADAGSDMAEASPRLIIGRLG